MVGHRSGKKTVVSGSGGTSSPGLDGDDGQDGISVTNAAINGSGDLILTLSNNSTINAGRAKGTDGNDGTDATVTKSSVEDVLTGEVTTHSHRMAEVSNAAGINDFWTGTQGAYDAISSKSSTTLYLVVG